MKSKIVVALVLILFISCQKDNAPFIEAQPETIGGVWNLKNVYGGLLPININYNLGEVKWTFNEAEGYVIIENNIDTTGPEDIYAGLDSGTYNYEIQLINDFEILYVDGEQIGAILMEANTLDIDHGLASDGFGSKFQR